MIERRKLRARMLHVCRGPALTRPRGQQKQQDEDHHAMAETEPKKGRLVDLKADHGLDRDDGERPRRRRSRRGGKAGRPGKRLSGKPFHCAWTTQVRTRRRRRLPPDRSGDDKSRRARPT